MRSRKAGSCNSGGNGSNRWLYRVAGVVFDLHRAPSTAGQQDVAVLFTHLGRHTDGVVTQGGDVGPVVVAGLVQTQAELPQQRVVALLLDSALDQLLLGAFGIVLGQDPIDLGLAGNRIGGLDVAADQVLHHIAGEFLVRFVPPRQRLEDHPVAQDLLDF